MAPFPRDPRASVRSASPPFAVYTDDARLHNIPSRSTRGRVQSVIATLRLTHYVIKRAFHASRLRVIAINAREKAIAASRHSNRANVPSAIRAVVALGVNRLTTICVRWATRKVIESRCDVNNTIK